MPTSPRSGAHEFNFISKALDNYNTQHKKNVLEGHGEIGRLTRVAPPLKEQIALAQGGTTQLIAARGSTQ